MMQGSCLCGKVTYEISGELGEIVHCHCITCRKAHGAAFSSVAAVPDNNFNLSGSDNLKSFESSKGKHRHFCTNCATQIYAKREGTEHIILRLGSLDSNPSSDSSSDFKTKERSHIWVSEKAQWYSINNTLPEYPESE